MYKDTISELIRDFPLPIDIDVRFNRSPPTTASSEFLTNKEQGDWAEQIVCNAINENSKDHIAVQYGRSESLSAGDVGFYDFYREYQNELNDIGKKPDILIFQKSDIPDSKCLDLSSDMFVQKAVAAIEVRSSSFLSGKYTKYMNDRTQQAEQECLRLKEDILKEPIASVLREKSPDIYNLLISATANTFHNLDFRLRSWSSSEDLRRLSKYLKRLKEQIKILHKRDYLSITPKIEDIALVNRWIQRFNVKHYYLQVFFDKAYIIAFDDILKTCSNPSIEGTTFSIERDIKNQGKTTIKINIQISREIIARIDMPDHVSAMKELDRGRLLFYVTFKGGRGYLDMDILEREVLNNE